VTEALPMTCQELVELVTDYFEDALSPTDRARFEAHLDSCDPCIHYLEQMQTTMALLGRPSTETLPPAAEAALLDAFRGWKAGAGTDVRPPGAEPAVAAAVGAETAEQRLVSAITAGDEAAFADVVRRHSPSMLRLAQLFVGRPALAEEVVQETWIAVLAGFGRFKGRSSLKTWICALLMDAFEQPHVEALRAFRSSQLRGRLKSAGQPELG
jgi:anti-sigma factor RsiW